MARCIDADELISKIAFHRDILKPYNVVAVSAFDAVIGFIKTRPTISPDEVRGVGEWIHTADEFGAYEKCSCCGKEYYCGPIAPFNYCPSCGAKMEVSDDA